jgi:phosphate:Na+ symporter
VQRELNRYLEACAVFLAMARGRLGTSKQAKEHHVVSAVLSRDIRNYAASLFTPGMAYDRADLVASLIEEADFTASLGETLHQAARRVGRERFSEPGRTLVDEVLDRIADALRAIAHDQQGAPPAAATPAHERVAGLLKLRERALRLDGQVDPVERGAILALLGTAERAFLLIEPINAERRSVTRTAELALAAA